MQFNVRKTKHKIPSPASLFPASLLPALFSPPPSLSSLLTPLIPFAPLISPAFTQWTPPRPCLTTLPLFLPLPLLPPLPFQINSPQRPNSPMDCQSASSPPVLSNASACRHIRSRITVVCAEVCHRAMLAWASFVLNAM